MDYIDLLVTDDDLTLGVNAEPELVDGRASIAQDIRHLVRESGLLVVMIAQRDPETIALNLNRIETLVDSDVRIKPGTARAVAPELETVLITAHTVKYGPIEVYL